jgi:hypothetical protein
MNTITLNDEKLILIYFNFRGLGQYIRLLLAYLSVEYTEYLFDDPETLRKNLPESVLACLKGKRVDK